MSVPHLGELAALATAILWTVSATAWTSAGKHVGALAVSVIRLVMALGLMMLYSRSTRGLWLPSDATGEQWLLLGGSGVCGFFLADLCLFKSFLLIGPRLSLLVSALTPPLATITSWALIGDRLSGAQWAGMCVTLAGVVWVVLERPNGSDHPIARRHHGRGVLLATISSVMMALGYVLTKAGIGHYDVVAATMIRVLAAMPGYVVLITVWRRWRFMVGAVRNKRVMAILALGSIFGPFVGVVCSMVAIREAKAGVVATIIATMPVLILPFSIFWYREKVSLRAVGGALIAVAGVALLMLF